MEFLWTFFVISSSQVQSVGLNNALEHNPYILFYELTESPAGLASSPSPAKMNGTTMPKQSNGILKVHNQNNFKGAGTNGLKSPLGVGNNGLKSPLTNKFKGVLTNGNGIKSPLNSYKMPTLSGDHLAHVKNKLVKLKFFNLIY